MNERYETGSILVTSNRAPTEWPDLFGNPLRASAGLDRLAHHAETLGKPSVNPLRKGGDALPNHCGTLAPIDTPNRETTGWMDPMAGDRRGQHRR